MSKSAPSGTRGRSFSPRRRTQDEGECTHSPRGRSRAHERRTADPARARRKDLSLPGARTERVEKRRRPQTKNKTVNLRSVVIRLTWLRPANSPGFRLRSSISSAPSPSRAHDSPLVRRESRRHTHTARRRTTILHSMSGRLVLSPPQQGRPAARCVLRSALCQAQSIAAEPQARRPDTTYPIGRGRAALHGTPTSDRDSAYRARSTRLATPLVPSRTQSHAPHTKVMFQSHVPQ